MRLQRPLRAMQFAIAQNSCVLTSTDMQISYIFIVHKEFCSCSSPETSTISEQGIRRRSRLRWFTLPHRSTTLVFCISVCPCVARPFGAWVVCVYLFMAVEGLRWVSAFSLTPFSFISCGSFATGAALVGFALIRT